MKRVNTPLAEPHSLEAEMSLIGAAILTTDRQMLGAIWSEVDRSHFYDVKHGAIWEGIGMCYVQHGKIDLVMLKQHLPAEDREELTTTAMTCAESVPTPTNWQYYARIVNAKHRTRKLMRACQEQAWRLSNATDDDDAITLAMDSLAEAGRVTASDESVQLAEAERGLMDMLERRDAQCVPTGIEVFDREFMGLPKTGLVSIFGYPASGKTTLTLTIAESLAKRGIPVRVFSYEQNATRVAATLLSAATGLPVHSWINAGNQPSPQETDILTSAIQAHNALDFGLIDRSLDAPGIFRECQAVGMRGTPGVAVVDYIQNLPGWGQFQELTPRITESMRWLQRIARDLGWLVLNVSQLDKVASKENRRPSLADGLGSSAIEQYSDMIVSVYRPHQREPNEDELGVMTWIARQRKCAMAVLKNKYGPNGEVDLAFDMKRMQFRVPSRDELQAWS